ncbi:MAG: hypothetical protein V1494_01130 [Candidatus Diapherotrites archaeon]
MQKKQNEKKNEKEIRIAAIEWVNAKIARLMNEMVALEEAHSKAKKTARSIKDLNFVQALVKQNLERWERLDEELLNTEMDYGEARAFICAFQPGQGINKAILGNPPKELEEDEDD